MLAKIADRATSSAQQEWILSNALSQIKSRAIADDITKAWLEIISSLAAKLEAHTVKERILPLALLRPTHHASNLRQRIISTVLLCACVKRFPEDKSLLLKLTAACQDTEAPVRLCITAQLPSLVKSTAECRNALSIVLNEVSCKLGFTLNIQLFKTRSCDCKLLVLPEGFVIFCNHGAT